VGKNPRQLSLAIPPKRKWSKTHGLAALFTMSCKKLRKSEEQNKRPTVLTFSTSSAIIMLFSGELLAVSAVNGGM